MVLPPKLQPPPIPSPQKSGREDRRYENRDDLLQKSKFGENCRKFDVHGFGH